jgi:hypothetical protein
LVARQAFQSQALVAAPHQHQPGGGKGAHDMVEAMQEKRQVLLLGKPPHREAQRVSVVQAE